MIDNEEARSLISRPSAALVTADGAARGILMRMTSGVLAVARAQQTLSEQPTHQVGEHRLREADHRQVLMWAQALSLSPEEVLQRLAQARIDNAHGETLAFAIDNGALTSLVWDFDALPLTRFEWVDGLQIRRLGFKQAGTPTPRSLAIHLPRLDFLWCNRVGLTELQLQTAPALTRLFCAYNELTALDVRAAPALTTLACDNNQLRTLTMSGVSALTTLWCQENQLAELDLTEVSQLNLLVCDYNRLQALQLPEASALTELWCRGNQLTRLPLAAMPGLRVLNCNHNHLRELDLVATPRLTSCGAVTTC
jgi:Leucine-rich repeat (LRR) protein